MMASMSRMYLNKFDPIKGIETHNVDDICKIALSIDLNKFDPIKGIETAHKIR